MFDSLFVNLFFIACTRTIDILTMIYVTANMAIVLITILVENLSIISFNKYGAITFKILINTINKNIVITTKRINRIISAKTYMICSVSKYDILFPKQMFD